MNRVISQSLQFSHQPLHVLRFRDIYDCLFALLLAARCHHLDAPIVAGVFRLLRLLLLSLHTTYQKGELTLLLFALVLLAAGLLAFRVSCDLVRVEKVCLSIIGKTVRESSEVQEEL